MTRATSGDERRARNQTKKYAPIEEVQREILKRLAGLARRHRLAAEAAGLPWPPPTDWVAMEADWAAVEASDAAKPAPDAVDPHAAALRLLGQWNTKAPDA